MRLILPCIVWFLCSFLWFCFKPFAAHGAEPPNVGLSSCLPALCCKGRVCTRPNPMQSEGSAGTRELEMLQSVLSWKNRDWNTQLKVFVSPHSTLGLYFFLCRVSLQPVLFLLLLFCFSWLGNIIDLEGSSERCSNPHSTTLRAVGSWKGKLLEVETSSLAFCPPQSHILRPGKQILQIYGLFHTMLLWGSHGLKWKHTNQPVPLGVLNKY